MLELKNLNLTYGKNQIIQDLSVTFEEGKTTAIVGPSGAGKSSLLRLINLLNIPTTGELQLDQQKLVFPGKYSVKTLEHYRENFGMVFQNFNLFPHLSVLENVTIGPIKVLKQDPTLVADKAHELLKLVGLADKTTSFPSQLSGGQQQRVAIARALAMTPKFILFDEPTSALDPELESEVLAVIKDLAEQHSSQIVVTHNLAFAREVADRIIFLEQGQIIFDGAPAEFFASDAERIKNFTNKIL